MIHLTGRLEAGKTPRCHVFLDGIPQERVVEADTNGGWLVRCKLNDDGLIFAEGEEIATEKVFGTVSAVLMEDWK